MRNPDNRKTVELPPAQKPIPLGFKERRQEERSAFTNLRNWLLEVVEGEGTDQEKLDTISLILKGVEKKQLSR